MLATKKQIRILKEHDGMVIVLNIPNTVKQAVHSAVKAQVARQESSDIDILSPDEYHITLFYFQDTGSMFKILKAAEVMGEELPSIKVKIGGLVRFAKVTDEGKTAIAAQIDAREIQKFRLLFQERLSAVDVDVEDEHGFTPHMTVAYVPQDIDLTLRLPTLSFQINQFGVWVGDKDRHVYDLNQDKVVRSVQLVVDRYKGGPGSGHYGHAGRRGHHGGSLPGSVALSIRTGRDRAERQAAAAGRQAAKAEKKKKKALEKLPIGVRNDKMEKLNLHENVKSSADEVLKRATRDKNPDIDSIDYIMQTYEFTDEKSGFRTEVTDIEVFRYGTGSATVVGKVYDRNGNQVGNFTREIHGDGEVHNDYLRLDESAQGTGFGKRFYQHQEEMNLAAGMDKTTIYANLDVGGYAWAKMGYDFQSSTTRSEMGTLLYGKWRQSDPGAQDLYISMITGSASDYDRVQSAFRTMERSFESMKAWEMAAYTTSDGQRIGKEVMMGSGWGAVKVLDDTSDGWNVGQIYYNR